MKLAFWLPELSIHFSATIRALSEAGQEVTVVACEELQAHRRAMGWPVPSLGEAQTIVAPDDRTIKEIIERAGSDCVHIVIGMRSRFFERVLTHFIHHQAHFGLFAEAPHPEGLRVLAKRALYTAQGLSLRRRSEFFFAMGLNGVNWYQKCGYPANTLFPCAYAVEKPTDDGSYNMQVASPDKFRIIFVGRCIPIKRVDLVIQALALLPDSGWTFTVVGDGPQKPEWQELSRKTGLSDRISFLSALPNKDAVSLIGQSDLLILPSVHEGWGAVVNEALMNGVPTLCSDTCGAADLLRQEWRGGTFRPGSVEALAVAIRHQINRGRATPERRRRIRDWSRCIEGSSVAKYILAVLEHVYKSGPRPTPPWDDCDDMATS